MKDLVASWVDENVNAYEQKGCVSYVGKSAVEDLLGASKQAELHTQNKGLYHALHPHQKSLFHPSKTHF